MKRSPVAHLVTWGTFIAPHVVGSSITHRVHGAEHSSTSLRASAVLNISSEVSGAGMGAAGDPVEVSAIFDLVDSSGTVVTTLRSTGTVSIRAAGSGPQFLHAAAAVSTVNLWTLRRPALYSVHARLVTTTQMQPNQQQQQQQQPVVLDAINITVGFRSLKFLPPSSGQAAFHLNDQPFKVRGFCDHNNFASVGMAVPERINLFRAQAARSVGGNGRRLSHNPGNPSMLDIYDRVGMVVMDETRQFQVGALYDTQLASMVRRDRNHASIIIWSLCNEQACGATPTDPVQRAGVSFRKVTDTLDGTRPTLGNMRSNDWGGLLTNVTDVEGFSHSGRRGINQFSSKFPDKPLWESECCSCNTQRGENSCQGAGCDGSTNKALGIQSSFNADCLADQTNASQGVPWVVGDMVWTLFDYYGEPSYGPWDRWPHGEW